MDIIRKEGKGIFIAVGLGLIAYFFSGFLGFNSLMGGLLLGMLLGNIFNIPAQFQSGISFTSSKLFETSLLFLAFSIDFGQVSQLGWKSFAGIAALVLGMVVVTIFLAKKLNCPSSTGWLIGFGTAICGSSAIAALAPSVNPTKEDVAISMAVVNLYGALGMLLLPLTFCYLNVSCVSQALIIGGGLHSVGNVAGAAYSLGTEVGSVAITIKLARVAMLSPALVLFNFWINKEKALHWKEHLKLPWYVWAFVLISIMVSLVAIPSNILNGMELTGKLILTIAMVAIGLRVSFKTLYTSGKKGLGFGLLIFVIQLVVLFAFSYWVG